MHHYDEVRTESDPLHCARPQRIEDTHKPPAAAAAAVTSDVTDHRRCHQVLLYDVVSHVLQYRDVIRYVNPPADAIELFAYTVNCIVIE